MVLRDGELPLWCCCTVGALFVFVWRLVCVAGIVAFVLVSPCSPIGRGNGFKTRPV